MMTLKVLAIGYSIGASIGIVLAAGITQFPFAEKVITPYVLAAGHDPDDRVGPIARAATRIRDPAARDRRFAGRRPDGDDQRRHRVPPNRPGQDRAGQIVWCQYVADLHQGPVSRWRCR